MILQSLYERYEDMVRDPDSGISPLHFCQAGISYAIEITVDGHLENIVNLRQPNKKSTVPVTMIVPSQGVRTSGVKPLFLCDKFDYLLGFKVDKDELRLTEKYFLESRSLHERLLGASTEPAALALLRFFGTWKPNKLSELPLFQGSADSWGKGSELAVFRVCGESRYIHENPDLQNIWIQAQSLENQDSASGQCLITGEQGVPIARIHENKIKGIRGAQAAGASIVSFNISSFCSYGKSQSFNAPVSTKAAFGYTTALNQLLGSRDHVLTNLGDMTVVFWSKGVHRSGAEDLFSAMFQGLPEDAGEDTEQTRLIKDVLAHLQIGTDIPHSLRQWQPETPFYVMGLSPNNSRLSPRFFWVGTLEQVIRRMGEHAADFALQKADGNFEITPNMFKILAATLRQGTDGKTDMKEMNQQLPSAVLRAVMDGGGYPHGLYSAVLSRIKADHRVDAVRAAIIKAYQLRYARQHDFQSLKEVLSVGLNTETIDVAYRLGRLFAILEKTQQNSAEGKLNSSIRDRFFGAASSTPQLVFPSLISLAQHHITKAQYGSVRDRDIQEVLNGVDQFPAYLDLLQKGRFVLGYYHQKQSFYTKKAE